MLLFATVHVYAAESTNDDGFSVESEHRSNTMYYIAETADGYLLSSTSGGLTIRTRFSSSSTHANQIW